MTPSNVFATRLPINEEWLNGVMMGDKDLSLFVFGEDTDPCVASCAAPTLLTPLIMVIGMMITMFLLSIPVANGYAALLELFKSINLIQLSQLTTNSHQN